MTLLHLNLKIPWENSPPPCKHCGASYIILLIYSVSRTRMRYSCIFWILFLFYFISNTCMALLLSGFIENAMPFFLHSSVGAQKKTEHHESLDTLDS